MTARTVDLPTNLRAAMSHPIACDCADCIRLIDIGSDHHYDCKCEVCARWWEVLGPETED